MKKSSTHVHYKALDDVPRRRCDEPARLKPKTDAEIDRAIADDPDAAPPLDASWFKEAELVLPEGKTMVTMRLDDDVLAWLKSKGKGYQTRINAILRQCMRADRGA